MIGLCSNKGTPRSYSKECPLAQAQLLDEDPAAKKSGQPLALVWAETVDEDCVAEEEDAFVGGNGVVTLCSSPSKISERDEMKASKTSLPRQYILRQKMQSQKEDESGQFRKNQQMEQSEEDGSEFYTWLMRDRLSAGSRNTASTASISSPSSGQSDTEDTSMYDSLEELDSLSHSEEITAFLRRPYPKRWVPSSAAGILSSTAAHPLRRRGRRSLPVGRRRYLASTSQSPITPSFTPLSSDAKSVAQTQHYREMIQKLHQRNNLRDLIWEKTDIEEHYFYYYNLGAFHQRELDNITNVQQSVAADREFQNTAEKQNIRTPALKRVDTTNGEVLDVVFEDISSSIEDSVSRRYSLY